MSITLNEFCEEIVSCLVKYGGLQEPEARDLLLSSKICVVDSEMDIDLLFHESPYYWAMRILHSENPQWHQDPSLWPPPMEYLEKWYGKKA